MMRRCSGEPNTPTWPFRAAAFAVFGAATTLALHACAFWHEREPYPNASTTIVVFPSAPAPRPCAQAEATWSRSPTTAFRCSPHARPTSTPRIVVAPGTPIRFPLALASGERASTLTLMDPPPGARLSDDGLFEWYVAGPSRDLTFRAVRADGTCASTSMAVDVEESPELRRLAAEDAVLDALWESERANETMRRSLARVRGETPDDGVARDEERAAEAELDRRRACGAHPPVASTPLDIEGDGDEDVFLTIPCVSGDGRECSRGRLVIRDAEGYFADEAVYEGSAPALHRTAEGITLWSQRSREGCGQRLTFYRTVARSSADVLTLVVASRCDASDVGGFRIEEEDGVFKGVIQTASDRRRDVRYVPRGSGFLGAL